MSQEAIPAWISIQRKTFTIWINHWISRRYMAISELERDLKDGIVLIQLLEILSNQALYKSKRPRANANPRVAQLENVSFSLAFLEGKGIKLGIDAADIVDGNLKMILSLIWALIFHYQLQVWVDTKDKQTAKGSLLNWVREAVIKAGLSPVLVKDFSRSFSDGRLFVCLVNFLRSGSISNSHVSSNPRETLHKAFESAEQFVGITPLLDIDDVIGGKVDEMCVMTYVSLFRVRSYELTKPKEEDIEFEVVTPPKLKAALPPTRVPPRPNSLPADTSAVSSQMWRASLMLHAKTTGKSQLNLTQILPQPPKKQQSFLVKSPSSLDLQQQKQKQLPQTPQKSQLKKIPPKRALPPQPQQSPSSASPSSSPVTSRSFNRSLSSQSQIQVKGDPVLEKMLSVSKFPPLPQLPQRVQSQKIDKEEIFNKEEKTEPTKSADQNIISNEPPSDNFELDPVEVNHVHNELVEDKKDLPITQSLELSQSGQTIGDVPQPLDQMPVVVEKEYRIENESEKRLDQERESKQEEEIGEDAITKAEEMEVQDSVQEKDYTQKEIGQEREQEKEQEGEQERRKEIDQQIVQGREEEIENRALESGQESEYEREHKSEHERESERDREREIQSETKLEEVDQDIMEQLQELVAKSTEQLNEAKHKSVQAENLNQQTSDNQESHSIDAQTTNNEYQLDSQDVPSAPSNPPNAPQNNNTEDILSAILSLTAAHHPDYNDDSQSNDLDPVGYYSSSSELPSAEQDLKPTTEAVTDDGSMNGEASQSNALNGENPESSLILEKPISSDTIDLKISENLDNIIDKMEITVTPPSDSHLPISDPYESKRQSIMGLFRLSTQIDSISPNTEEFTNKPRSNVLPAAPFLALALFDYDPDKTDENELAFSRGDIVTILETNESGWWKGEHCGYFGWVPNEFVSPLDLHEAEEARKRASMSPVQQLPQEEKTISKPRTLTTVSSNNETNNNSNNNNNTNNSSNIDSNPSSPTPTEPITPRTAKSNFLRTFQPQLQPTIVRQPSVVCQPEVIKAGYLRKKGAKRRNWTKRWFVLRGSHTLTYYKNDKADKPKGSVVLDLAVVGKSQRKPFGFFVRTPDRILMLWPLSKEERDAWIEAISGAITVQYYGVDFDIEQSVWGQKFMLHVNDVLYKSAIKLFKQ